MSERSIIVLVEDDPNIADLVDLYLTNEGHRVYQATAGARALEVCSLRKPDLVILDIGLAGEMDGFDVCRSLRTDSNVPIIMLTARHDEIDRVVGFELGADDYVVKPFSPRELMGRVRAILRRSGTSVADNTQLMTIGSLQIDGQRCEALLDGQPVSLAAQEWALLWFFAQNRGLALTRRQLLDGGWGSDWVGDIRTVDVHVRQLRRKLDDALPVKTVRGIGYRFD